MRSLLIFCIFILSACGEPVDPRVGMDISSIALKNSQLKNIPLSTFKGKPSIINIWASWCTPCIKELPSLMVLQEQGEYQVILINIDSKQLQGEKILEKYGIQANITLWDENGKITRSELSAMQLPQTFITNNNMIIKGVEIGDKKWDSPNMLERIQNHLK